MDPRQPVDDCCRLRMAALCCNGGGEGGRWGRGKGEGERLNHTSHQCPSFNFTIIVALRNHQLAADKRIHHKITFELYIQYQRIFPIFLALLPVASHIYHHISQYQNDRKKYCAPYIIFPDRVPAGLRQKIVSHEKRGKGRVRSRGGGVRGKW